MSELTEQKTVTYNRPIYAKFILHKATMQIGDLVLKYIPNISGEHHSVEFPLDKVPIFDRSGHGPFDPPAYVHMYF